MNEKEIMQWAVEGIASEISRQEKYLKRDLLLMQSHRKGINNNINPDKVNERIENRRAEIELLSRKKAFLIVRLDE